MKVFARHIQLTRVCRPDIACRTVTYWLGAWQLHGTVHEPIILDVLLCGRRSLREQALKLVASVLQKHATTFSAMKLLEYIRSQACV